MATSPLSGTPTERPVRPTGQGLHYRTHVLLCDTRVTSYERPVRPRLRRPAECAAAGGPPRRAQRGREPPEETISTEAGSPALPPGPAIPADKAVARTLSDADYERLSYASRARSLVEERWRQLTFARRLRRPSATAQEPAATDGRASAACPRQLASATAPSAGARRREASYGQFLRHPAKIRICVPSLWSRSYNYLRGENRETPQKNSPWKILVMKLLFAT